MAGGRARQLPHPHALAQGLVPQELLRRCHYCAHHAGCIREPLRPRLGRHAAAVRTMCGGVGWGATPQHDVVRRRPTHPPRPFPASRCRAGTPARGFPALQEAAGRMARPPGGALALGWYVHAVGAHTSVSLCFKVLVCVKTWFGGQAFACGGFCGGNQHRQQNTRVCIWRGGATQGSPALFQHLLSGLRLGRVTRDECNSPRLPPGATC